MTIRSRHFSRTYKIIEPNLGTGFLFNRNGKEYFITAAHVACREGLVVASNEDKGIPLDCRLLRVQDDVAVFETNTRMNNKYTTDDCYDCTLVYGQDVYVLGFPGTHKNIIDDFGHPIPIVTKAVFSGFSMDRLWFGGVIGRGFSGGPVIAINQNGNEFYVGIVLESEYKLSPIQTEGLSDVQHHYFEQNAGLFMAYEMVPIVQLIDKWGKPNGY